MSLEACFTPVCSLLEKCGNKSELAQHVKKKATIGEPFKSRAKK